VVEPYPSEKYEFVKWDYCSQYGGEVIKFMFQTTNQLVNRFEDPKISDSKISKVP